MADSRTRGSTEATSFDLAIGDVIESANYQPGQVGWRITKGGLIDAWGASFRGNVQSGNFTPGDGGTGWRLSYDGTGELDAAYIRGLWQQLTLIRMFRTPEYSGLVQNSWITVL